MDFLKCRSTSGLGIFSSTYQHTMSITDQTTIPKYFKFIEAPFNAFANRADPDQAAIIRAA